MSPSKVQNRPLNPFVGEQQRPAVVKYSGGCPLLIQFRRYALYEGRQEMNTVRQDIMHCTDITVHGTQYLLYVSNYCTGGNYFTASVSVGGSIYYLE